MSAGGASYSIEPGMSYIDPREGENLQVILPGFHHPSLRELESEFEDNVTGDILEGYRLAEELNLYVADYFEPAEYSGTVQLGEVIENGEGSCVECSLTFGCLAERQGFDVKMVTGDVEREDIRGHAWLVVEIGGDPVLADPALNLFGRYDEVKDARGYEEEKLLETRPMTEIEEIDEILAPDGYKGVERTQTLEWLTRSYRRLRARAESRSIKF